MKEKETMSGGLPPDYNPSEELIGLLSELFDGDVSPERRKRLQEILRNDPAARAYYYGHIRMHSCLNWWKRRTRVDIGSAENAHSSKENPLDSGGLSSAAGSKSSSPLLGFLGSAMHSGWESLANNAPLVFLLLIAAVGMSFMGLLYWGATWLERRFSRSEGPVMVAKITALKDCRFVPGETAPTESMQLEKGRQLHLEKGLLQITYDTGAKVLLAGPATYKIESNNAGYLGLGKLTARVETIEAEGFTINTPNARFVDLGTEFGVKVDARGRDEVHVFAGRVNAETKTAEGGFSAPRALHRGEAFVFDGKTTAVQVARPLDFPSLVAIAAPSTTPSAAPPDAAFARWQAASKELQKRQDLMAYYDFQKEESSPELLLNKSPTGAELNGKIQGPLWVQGRFPGKGALEFKRPRSGVRLNLPKPMTSLTLVAWVNIESLPHTWNGFLMSNATSGRNQFQWLMVNTGNFGLGTNNEPKGPPAKPWQMTPELFNRWCFLATVCDASTVRMIGYFNGQLVETNSFEKFGAFKIGWASIGTWNIPNNDAPDNDFTLDGRMDELMIFDTALSAEEMQKIYEAGKP
jgi:hypothetical protein